MWSEKHRPKSIACMVGNDDARASLLEWLSKWNTKSKPALLVGPPGVGKTTASMLAAKQYGYGIIEMNASDARSKSRINELLEPVMQNTGITGDQLVFIDEVDGIHGRADYGGAEALIRLIKDSPVPVIMAANSDQSTKMKSITKASVLMRFSRLPPRMMRVYLRRVLDMEGASLSPGSEIRTVSESRGDIRYMMNLAQSLATGASPQTQRPEETPELGDTIEAFFASKDMDEARRILYSVRLDPREKINAFYSSIITSGLPPAKLAPMMRAISDADILYGRIRRTQQWRLLRYLDAILCGAFLPNTGIKYSQYNLSWPLLNRIRWDARTLKKLFVSMGSRMHVSAGRFGTLYFPIMLQCVRAGVLNMDADAEYEEIIQKEMDR